MIAAGGADILSNVNSIRNSRRLLRTLLQQPLPNIDWTQLKADRVPDSPGALQDVASCLGLTSTAPALPSALDTLASYSNWDSISWLPAAEIQGVCTIRNTPACQAPGQET